MILFLIGKQGIPNEAYLLTIDKDTDVYRLKSTNSRTLMFNRGVHTFVSELINSYDKYIYEYVINNSKIFMNLESKSIDARQYILSDEVFDLVDAYFNFKAYLATKDSKTIDLDDTKLISITENLQIINRLQRNKVKELTESINAVIVANKL